MWDLIDFMMILAVMVVVMAVHEQITIKSSSFSLTVKIVIIRMIVKARQRDFLLQLKLIIII